MSLGGFRWGYDHHSGDTDPTMTTATLSHGPGSPGAPARPGVQIAVAGLTKRFGRLTAVDNLDFTVEPGRVTGFLGPNGAGKTTTLRMLLGLVQPTAGTATIGGSTYHDLAQPLQTVGASLEASNFHPGRSGRDHLRVLADASGIPTRRVDELLELVGIPAPARQRAGGYSMGMRQRLALAAALLGDPQVLLLDEPANGLDPQGIHWMRGLLRDFADRGGAVLLSSHLLAEVQAVADDIVVIGRGRIVAQGPVAELVDGLGAIARSLDDAALVAALEAAGHAAAATASGVVVEAEPVDVARIALAAGIVVTDLRPHGAQGLEDLFLRLTADDAREVAA